MAGDWNAGYGFTGFIGFAPEASGGTPVAVSEYMTAMSENLNMDITRYDTVNIHGSFSEPDDEDGIREVSGDIVSFVDPHNLGYFLYGALGQYTSEVDGSSLIKHEYIVPMGDWDRMFSQPPFTFEIYRGVGDSQQYSGVCVSQLDFALSGNNALQMTAGLVGLSEDNITKTSPTFPSSPGFPFNFSTCSISIGGGANADIESFTFTISNNLEAIPSLANTGKYNTKIKRNGPTTVRFAGDIGFEGMDEYNAFRNQTERALSISLTLPSSFQLVLEIPRFVYTTFPTEIGGRDRLVVGFEGLGRFHAGSGTNVKATLTNVTSSYLPA